ncbi:MbcA/ParS/Xre antitoxin family protein [Microbulbifer litoralis]|uniref:MbcA/ParS/Xre antitoxin family protein n=1 Tax=Microbulbifer litoralis TaxID=2933965 RepID=UPI002028825F|nr:MbcA/ParS/Xre antitoxin family protein [Microbulbifer sp. GX H0434]
MLNQKYWENYSKLFLEDFEESTENKELIDMVGDKEIAAVIKFHIGSNYRNWLESRVDALGGKTPRECLSSKEGADELKEMLMKIH